MTSTTDNRLIKRKSLGPEWAQDSPERQAAERKALAFAYRDDPAALADALREYGLAPGTEGDR
jgi:hypothetical protein